MTSHCLYHKTTVENESFRQKKTNCVLIITYTWGRGQPYHLMYYANITLYQGPPKNDYLQ